MGNDSDPLEGRVARFSQLEGNEGLFIDTAIPGYAREIWSIVGENVGEDRSESAAIPADGFHLAVIRAEPGNGTALHTHTTVEVFMPLSGRWQIFYGENEEFELILEERDVCSVPPGVWRGFRNAGDEEGYLLVVVAGTDAGRLEWAPHVLEEARSRGMELDAEGYIADGEVANNLTESTGGRS